MPLAGGAAGHLADGVMPLAGAGWAGGRKGWARGRAGLQAC